MDDTLQARVEAVINKYRDAAETDMKKGDLLAGRRRYREALDTFEAVLQEFPFPEIQKHAAIRRTQIRREIQGILGGRP